MLVDHVTGSITGMDIAKHINILDAITPAVFFRLFSRPVQVAVQDQAKKRHHKNPVVADEILLHHHLVNANHTGGHSHGK